MITSIFADGYRSLSKLDLKIQAGLNILVGPNGGGKTNILSFFQFLTSLNDTPVDQSVSLHGGVSRVFARKSQNEFHTSFRGRVEGQFPMVRHGARQRLFYIWEFEIASTEQFDNIYYKSQSLRINMVKKPKNYDDYDLVIKFDKNKDNKKISVDKLVVTRLQHFFRSIINPFYIDNNEYVSKQLAEDFLKNFERANLQKNSMVRGYPYNQGVMHQIAEDISGGEIFNILPEVVKKPEDSATPATIENTGAGLASTLYRIEKQNSLDFTMRAGGRIRRKRKMISMDSINNYVSLINDSILGVTTDKDPIHNTIAVFVKVFNGEKEVLFPLAHCSDGTIKWIALIVKLLTSEAGFSIEEPENFLHPDIQKEFVHIGHLEK